MAFSGLKKKKKKQEPVTQTNCSKALKKTVFSCLFHFFCSKPQVDLFQDLSKDEVHMVIREAQGTCVRLADDVLGAAETSQMLGSKQGSHQGVDYSGFI